MNENVPDPSSCSHSESPSAITTPLLNSRDCKAYLLSLPSGDAALHHAIKQAKQSVHSQAGTIVAQLVQQFSAPGATSNGLISAAGRQSS